MSYVKLMCNIANSECKSTRGLSSEDAAGILPNAFIHEVPLSVGSTAVSDISFLTY